MPKESIKFETIYGVRHMCIRYIHGDETWWLENREKGDKRHRENGPAIIRNDGKKAWYLNGDQLTEQEFNKILIKKRLKRL